MSSDQNILVKLNEAGLLINDKWLVKGVSLQVEKGQIVTLIGPNGSGKSTTAKIALGIYKQIDGSVEKYTNKVGYVPQKISIDWTLPLRVSDFMVLTESLNNETIDEALSLTGVIHSARTSSFSTRSARELPCERRADTSGQSAGESAAR